MVATKWHVKSAKNHYNLNKPNPGTLQRLPWCVLAGGLVSRQRIYSSLNNIGSYCIFNSLCSHRTIYMSDSTRVGAKMPLKVKLTDFDGVNVWTYDACSQTGHSLKCVRTMSSPSTYIKYTSMCRYWEYNFPPMKSVLANLHNTWENAFKIMLLKHQVLLITATTVTEAEQHPKVVW